MEKKVKQVRSPKGGVTMPLPPELVEWNSPVIVSPKTPDQIEREQEERLKELRRAKGL